MIQTGIQACPIQALPIIFLGSSYRKRTWIFDPIHLNPCKICFIFSPHLFSHQSPHHRGSSSALACNIPSMNLRPISKPNHCNEDLLMMTIQSVTFDPALSIACCHLEMGSQSQVIVVQQVAGLLHLQWLNQSVEQTNNKIFHLHS